MQLDLKYRKGVWRRLRGSQRILLIFALVVIAAACGEQVSVAEEKSLLKLDSSLIALDTQDGQRLLEESKAKRSFVTLSMYFTTQDNLAYCGAASMCMVLNASGIERPISPNHRPYRLFTQSNVFTSKVCKVTSSEQVRKSGMTLKTLGDALACFRVKVDVVHASDTDLAGFRKSAIDVVTSQDKYLVVNYLRKSIKQESGGHISPVAAYHEGEDRFLIMDVSRYKYPPVWVKSDRLWAAMKAVDSDSGKSRGYVILCPTQK